MSFWGIYRGTLLATLVMTALAVALHWRWMPAVSYDPLAPFTVLMWTLEGTYFPVLALVAWLVGKGTQARIAVESAFSFERWPMVMAILIPVAAVTASFLKWSGFINLVALGLWFHLAACAALKSRDRHWYKAIEWILVAILFAAASYIFTIVKSGLFHLNAPNDALIVRLEAAIATTDVYVYFAGLGAGWGRAAVRALESVYFQFFSHMLLVSIFLSSAGEELERRRYALALIICYLVGGFSYYALPALGPVFFDPGRFEFLKASAPTAWSIQQLLAHNTAAAQADFAGLTKLNVYGFIACMPSLHLAHESIMLYYCRRSRIAFSASLVFYAATCISVLVLGWHYALDIPVGILLAFLVIRFVTWVTPVMSPKPVTV